MAWHGPWCLVWLCLVCLVWAWWVMLELGVLLGMVHLAWMHVARVAHAHDRPLYLCLWVLLWVLLWELLLVMHWVHLLRLVWHLHALRRRAQIPMRRSGVWMSMSRVWARVALGIAEVLQRHASEGGGAARDAVVDVLNPMPLRWYHHVPWPGQPLRSVCHVGWWTRRVLSLPRPAGLASCRWRSSLGAPNRQRPARARASATSRAVIPLLGRCLPAAPCGLRTGRAPGSVLGAFGAVFPPRGGLAGLLNSARWFFEAMVLVKLRHSIQSVSFVAVALIQPQKDAVSD
mmetsp:Transcript_56992/g.127062  ORF Transcript_56992/g.127062 Transcript_56992/m.127062 type:complete len:288 (-) Transcript_56992:172-1035(-)